MILAAIVLLKMFFVFAYLVVLAIAVHMARALPNCAAKRILLKKVFD